MTTIEVKNDYMLGRQNENILYYECVKLQQENKQLKETIDKAISLIYLLKNNVKDYDTEYKEDFLNMLDDIGNILGDKE